jgi:hypothetical protein
MPVDLPAVSHEGDDEMHEFMYAPHHTAHRRLRRFGLHWLAAKMDQRLGRRTMAALVAIAKDRANPQAHWARQELAAKWADYQAFDLRELSAYVIGEFEVLRQYMAEGVFYVRVRPGQGDRRVFTNRYKALQEGMYL